MFAAALAVLAGACATLAQSIPGLDFRQMDLAFPGVPAQPDSQFGLAGMNVSTILSNNGPGFLNISTDQGWVVRNFPIDPNMVSAGVTNLGMMFDLGSTPGRIGSVNAFAAVSPQPVAGFSGGPLVPYTVPANSNVIYNAQGVDVGAGVNRAGPAAGRINWNGITFDPNKPTSMTWQPNHDLSVEQDVNQCGPASVANSLQYLKNRNGLPVPHANIPGIAGNPPNSLVGQLDNAMGRAQGQGLSTNAIVNGKAKYLADNGLGDKLIYKQYGLGNANINTPSGLTVFSGSAGGQSLADWLIGELQHGEDVELVIDWAGGGAHAVTLIGGGRIAGVPFFAWSHDAKQGQAGGTGYLDGGLGFSFLDEATGGFKNFMTNGLGLNGLNDATLRFALSESVPTPGTLGLLMAAGVFAARRRRAVA
jgi:hypothetical protein